MRQVWLLGAAMAALALAACQPPDPLNEARQTCARAEAEAEARTQACTELLDSGELADADKAAAHANRGAAHYEAGDVTAALRDYEASLRIEPNMPLAIMGRAGILIDSGQLDAAEPLVQQLIESGEYAAQASYYAGNIALARGQSDAAIAAYDRAIAADGRHAFAYANRGAAKQRLENYAGAIEDYDAAVRINPQLPQAYAGLCWSRVLMEDGDQAQARSAADAAAAGDPRNVQGQLCRGLLQLRAGEWADAQASYEAALAVEPGNPTALFGRGIARRRGGDNTGTRDMNQAREFSPHVARAFEELGVRTY
jgi:tetratricopeptide (TPR) repeat protein